MKFYMSFHTVYHHRWNDIFYYQKIKIRNKTITNHYSRSAKLLTEFQNNMREKTTIFRKIQLKI